MSRNLANSSSVMVKRRHSNSNYKKCGGNVLNHPDLTAVIEIVKNKFYFATLIPEKREPTSTPNFFMFDIDDELVYNNFFDDFGPLNIACLHKYCYGVNEILKSPKYQQSKIVHFTSTIPEKRANAAYLVASYSLLYLNKTPNEAHDLIASPDCPPLKHFQDASMGDSPYTIELIDCLNALQRASILGFFNLDDFDLQEYEKYEQVRQGDMNWIIPRKFIAFLGPSTEPGAVAHYPEKYLNYFMKNDVTVVIRLNRKTYESFRYSNAGILHYDMFFPDGTAPPNKILKQFLHVAESTRGAIAVHCKAGLGRTGTLIAAYAMKHYRMTAREAIAWLRICRPGSVIGPQQAWLQAMESSLWREGRRHRLKYHGDENLMLHHRRGIYSVASKHDKRVRFTEYLSKESVTRTLSENKLPKKNDASGKKIRCSSARECKRQKYSEEYRNTKDEENREEPQGERLNEIKMKRSKINSDSFYVPKSFSKSLR